jgi:hypothetical protein
MEYLFANSNCFIWSFEKIFICCLKHVLKRRFLTIGKKSLVVDYSSGLKIEASVYKKVES